jgi:hypothetical protein
MRTDFTPSKAIPSPTKLARRGHFPPPSQAGRLAGPVFYVRICFFSACTSYTVYRARICKHLTLTNSGSRVPGFLSSRPNWLPRPLIRNRVLSPLWFQGGGHTRLRERGGEPIRTKGQTLWGQTPGKRGMDQIRRRQKRKEKGKKDEGKNSGPLPCKLYCIRCTPITKSACLSPLFFRS